MGEMKSERSILRNQLINTKLKIQEIIVFSNHLEILQHYETVIAKCTMV